MQKLPLIVLLLANLCVFAQTNNWEAEIAAFEASDRTNPPPANGIVFVGSSSIRYWKTLARDFPKHKVINRGFGGSKMSDSVRFADRIVIPYKPRLVIVYAGGNDINFGKAPETVFHDFKAFVAKVHAALPATRIAYISIAPNPARWSQVDKVKAANALVAEFARQQPKVEYIDVFSHMLGADGLPRPEIFSADRLHMNERGYELWTQIIQRHL